MNGEPLDDENPHLSFAPDDTPRWGWLLWPIHHPRLAIAVMIALAVMAVLGVLRIRPDTSLEGLFPRGSEAATALSRVLKGFSVAEELLLLVSEQQPGGADPQKLIAYAERFKAAVQRDAAASAMAEDVIFRTDEQTRKFFETVVVPAGLYYLDDPTYAAVRQRLTRPAMEEQIQRNEAMIATPGPAAGAISKALLQDPLRLHEFFVEQMKAQETFKTRPGTDAFVSPDGKNLLIRIPGQKPVSDLDFTRVFMQRMRKLAADANQDGLKLDFSGAYAIAAESERSIRSDAISSTFTSLLYLTILFCIAYRRPIRLFILAFTPVALGNLLGFGAYSLWSTALTPMTAVIGAMLAEMGINYSIHYLSLNDAQRDAGANAIAAATRTSREIALPLLAAYCTSIVGFLAVGFSSLKVLREFAILGSFALAGAVVATMILLPAILILLDRSASKKLSTHARMRFGFSPMLNRLVAYARPLSIGFWTIFIAALVVMAWPGTRLAMETDLTIMHPRPNAPLDAQAAIADTFGSAPGSLIVYLQSNSDENLQRLAHEVNRRLKSPAAAQAGVSATFGLSTLLPDPAVAGRAISPAEAEKIVGDFRSVIANSSFEPRAYEPYAAFLHTLLTRPAAPTVADLKPFNRLAGSVLPRDAALSDRNDAARHESIVMVSLNHSLADRAQRTASINAIRTALRDLPGATLAGMDVVSHDLESTIYRDLPLIMGIGFGAVIAYLLIHFRSVRDMVLVVLPTAFSLAILLALMRLTGQKINVFNLVSAPLLIGINIDYGIFLVSLQRSAVQRNASAAELIAEIGTSCHAVIVCAITTLLGFGSLYFTSIPAIRSLGYAVSVGVCACLIATLVYLAPLLIRSIGPSEAGSQGEPEPVA